MSTTSPAAFPYRWLVLAVVLVAEIVDVLDSTVVNVAGPVLARELGASSSALQWVIGGYTLALGAGLIIGGRLGDRFGRRQLFLVGLVSFTVASLACALAPTIETLIAFRIVQGLAGAVLLPQGFGLLRDAFPPSEIGKAFAVFGPVFGLAGIVGPILGGGIISADFFGTGWRFVFLINIPIGIAAIIIALRVLPRVAGSRAIQIDLVGAAIVAAASALLVWPLIQGREAGWPAWTWVMIVAALVGFALFAVQQRAVAARGGTPLATPSLFRKRSYVVGLGGIALFFAGMTGLQLVYTLFLQLGQQFTAGEAGLGSLPLAIGTAVGGAVSGAILADKLGRVALQGGAAVQLLGAVLLWIALSGGGAFSIWQVVPGLVVAGVGMGIVVAALFNVVLGGLDDSEVGSASGVLTAVQSIGAAVGVAFLGSVFFDVLRTDGPAAAFQRALVVQGVLLVVFLVLSTQFPRRARPEGEAAVASAEVPAA